jgi:hypothetical protein
VVDQTCKEPATRLSFHHYRCDGQWLACPPSCYRVGSLANGRRVRVDAQEGIKGEKDDEKKDSRGKVVDLKSTITSQTLSTRRQLASSNQPAYLYLASGQDLVESSVILHSWGGISNP